MDYFLFFFFIQFFFFKVKKGQKFAAQTGDIHVTTITFKIYLKLADSQENSIHFFISPKIKIINSYSLHAFKSHFNGILS